MQIAQQQNDIQKTGVEGSKKATINQDKLAKLQYILTKGLYQDPIGSLINEWSANAIDGVVQSGKNPIENPVIVTITDDKFTVKDTGIGISKEDFQDVCMNYLSSTKEDDNSVIGHFGLGMKVFMALDRGAIFTIVKDGIECKFLAYQGNEFMEYDLIYEKPTTDSNGVICEISIKDWREKEEFETKAIKRLSYYDTVVLYIDGQIIENKIIRSEDWQYSNNSNFRHIHICLKDVVYELNYNQLGINPINLPIALRFSLDSGLTPTPSRESLIYSQETKKLILDKIKVVSEWFINKYNESWKEEESVVEAWDKIGNTNKEVVIADVEFLINPLIQHSDIAPKELKIKGIDLETPKYYKNLENKLLKEYECIVDYESYKWNIKRIYKANLASWVDNCKLIEVDSVPTGRYKKWLLQKYSGKILFIKKTYQRQLGKTTTLWNHRKDEDYLYLLNLVNYKKTEWRKRISELQLVENQFKSLIINEVGTETCKEYLKWLENYKEELKLHRKQYGTSGNYKGLNKGESDITIGYLRKRNKWKSTFSPKKEACKINDLHKHPYLTIYTSMEEHLEDFKIYAKMFPKVKFCLIGKREINKLPKGLKNHKTIKEFMSQLTKPFVKVVTARKVNEVLQTYDSLLRNEIVQNVLNSLKEDCEELQKYKSEYFYDIDEEVADSIYQYAKENNIYDREIMEVVERVEKSMKDYEFISLLEMPNSWELPQIEKYRKFINQHLCYKKLYNKESLPEYKLVKVKKKEPGLAQTV